MTQVGVTVTHMDTSSGFVDEVRGAIAGELRALRARSGMTRPELAAASGVSKSTLARLEAGERSLDFPTLLLITEAVGADAVKFMQSVQESLGDD